MNAQIYQVGMADMKLAQATGKLVTLGLGSCVAICGYDPALKIAAMVHVMLPTNPGTGEFNPAKFGDTAVPLMLTAMMQIGAYRPRIWVKLVGGARMFAFGSDDLINNIGRRNVETIEQVLTQNGVLISAKLVGGTMGRSVYMDVATGEIEVKTINQGITHI